jgi:hypothetical protein
VETGFSPRDKREALPGDHARRKDKNPFESDFGGASLRLRGAKALGIAVPKTKNLRQGIAGDFGGYS